MYAVWHSHHPIHKHRNIFLRNLKHFSLGILNQTFVKHTLMCQAWWSIPLIRAFGRQRQEDLTASLIYITSSKIAMATQRHQLQKSKQNKKESKLM